MSSPMNGAASQPAPGNGARAFTRNELEQGQRSRLSEGRWANAVLYRFEHSGSSWVVKDFSSRSFLVRNTIGRLLVRREIGGLRKVDGIPGTPTGAFRVDAYALAYRFVPGRGLRRFRDELKPGFFPRLEQTVLQMHERARIAHLDMRNADNLLVTESGEPMLLDLQSNLGTRFLPAPLRRFVESIDLAAIYKHWARRSPDTMGPERTKALERMNRLRPLWVLRGYIGAERPGRKTGKKR